MTGPGSPLASMPLPRTGELADLHAYWAARRRDGRLPSRADIDPLEMRRWLGNLMLLDVLDGGADFRYRLYGTVLRVYFEAELTGRTVRGSEARIGRVPFEEYAACIQTAEPLFVSAGTPPGKPFLQLEKLILPLAADGGTVDMMLVGIYPASDREIRPQS